MADSLALLSLLIGLELVLGVDNILVISIFVGRLPESQRGKARVIGLGLAMVARIVMFFILLTLSGLTNKLWVIITAVVLSFVLILIFARPIGFSGESESRQGSPDTGLC